MKEPGKLDNQWNKLDSTKDTGNAKIVISTDSIHANVHMATPVLLDRRRL